MEKWKKILNLLVIVLTNTAGIAQSNDNLFYRHSFQFNIAGLGFERWGMAYELRMTPRHALFVQGGGSFPFISEDKEYGFGLHYKYFLRPVREARFLWLFKSAYRNSFADLNIRYMNLDGIDNGAQCLYEAYFIGAGVGQTYLWNSGFTISYWLGYGPLLVANISGRILCRQMEMSWPGCTSMPQVWISDCPSATLSGTVKIDKQLEDIYPN